MLCLVRVPHQVSTAQVGQDEVVSFAQQIFLLSQGIEHHQVEEDTDQSQGHVCGHHDHSFVHSWQQFGLVK